MLLLHSFDILFVRFYSLFALDPCIGKLFQCSSLSFLKLNDLTSKLIFRLLALLFYSVCGSLGYRNSLISSPLDFLLCLRVLEAGKLYHRV